MSKMHDARQVAVALGGEAYGTNRVIAPGPGHSRRDRSLSIKIDPQTRDGFLVHSFAGDDPLVCRAHVRTLLGLVDRSPIRREARRHIHPPAASRYSCAAKAKLALSIWCDGQDPRGNVVEKYLRLRGLELADELCHSVVRFHPSLRFGEQRCPGMVTLFRDIRTNEPCGIQRTFLHSDGSKIARWSLGRMGGAAIKLDADECVAFGLHICEGFETGLAAFLGGLRPVWALGNADAVGRFPVLPPIDCITILAENDETGSKASEKCAERWLREGKEVLTARPMMGKDIADAYVLGEGL